MSTWYEKAVFYHMYPLGMVGAPKQNCEAEVSDRFDELVRWIPHMRELGCSAVYIGPLFESSTHGYDTRDFKIVDRRLGTNDDFKRFVSLCHDSGIQVVVDGVFNHTGREFFAFQDIRERREQSRYTGWYKGLNFGWNSPMGDSFGYECWRGIWELPCLNLQNGELKQYLFDVVRYWTEEFDIDGIRLDCAGVLDFQFMKELRSFTDTLKDDFWLMGEVIHGEYGRWTAPDMLHSVTNYEMHKSIYSAHNDHNYFELAHNVRRLESVGRSLYTFVDNHDEDRIASKLTDPAHLMPVYALLYTLPGIPSVYYGSEWGIEGHRSSTSDEVLRPRMDISEWEKKELPLTEWIARLGTIHNQEPAFHNGRYQELLLTNRQYAFARFPNPEAATGALTASGAPAAAIVTAANNDSQPATVSIPWKERGTMAEDLLTGATYELKDGRLTLELPAAGAAILKITEG